MEKRSALYSFLVFGGLIGLCFIFALALSSSGGGSGDTDWGGGSGPHIGVVDITGPILDSKDAVARLHELRKDDHIKAILVRINSPGGAVAPSQEIHQAIQRARKTKKVICSMGTVAASGGYYIAAACDKIYASAGTITGSIGVISQITHVQGLMQLARVEVDVIKSGALKDSGSPFRPMTPEERGFFQHFVDGVYEQFLGDVATDRKIDKNELRLIADGRILTGLEAKQAKLVDEIGNFEDALEAAGKLAGATGDPVPVFEKKPGRGLIGELMRGAMQEIEPRGRIEARDPRL